CEDIQLRKCLIKLLVLDNIGANYPLWSRINLEVSPTNSLPPTHCNSIGQ
ncbi:10966_t:CDS:1, partial [Paraglomus brasilianum]